MSTNYPNTISWFEIPVTDIARATTFFETVLDIQMEKMEMGPSQKMSVFPSPKNNGMSVHGALVQAEGCTPSKTGTLVYFYGGDDLNFSLNRVEAAGGKVIKPKFAIGDHGFCAMFEDTEGNTLAFHSMQ